MDMNNVNIEEIVKQVLSGMTSSLKLRAAASAEQMLMSTKMTRLVLSQ